jgi:hypothetical protein
MQTSDRRGTDRLRLRIPMSLHLWKSSVPYENVESLNLSENGVYFTTDCVLHEGEIVELFLSMPEELTGALATIWQCTGHVVHVETTGSPRDILGVGVQFDCYEISRIPKTMS